MIQPARPDAARHDARMPSTTARKPDNHVWSPTPTTCWHCGAPTYWFDVAFEVPLCPGCCHDAAVRAYEATLRRRHRSNR